MRRAGGCFQATRVSCSRRERATRTSEPPGTSIGNAEVFWQDAEMETFLEHRFAVQIAVKLLVGFDRKLR